MKLSETLLEMARVQSEIEDVEATVAERLSALREEYAELDEKLAKSNGARPKRKKGRGYASTVADRKRASAFIRSRPNFQIWSGDTLEAAMKNEGEEPIKNGLHVHRR